MSCWALLGRDREAPLALKAGARVKPGVEAREDSAETLLRAGSLVGLFIAAAASVGVVAVPAAVPVADDVLIRGGLKSGGFRFTGVGPTIA